MSIVPVLIIIPSVIIFKEKLKWKEVLGAFLAMIGVAMFFV
jgi:drug/metabolite transporter (DMT)-like permease